MGQNQAKSQYSSIGQGRILIDFFDGLFTLEFSSNFVFFLQLKLVLIFKFKRFKTSVLTLLRVYTRMDQKSLVRLKITAPDMKYYEQGWRKSWKLLVIHLKVTNWTKMKISHLYSTMTWTRTPGWCMFYVVFWDEYKLAF